MNKTQIEWSLNPDGTPGYTWNPITGCLNNCEYCYARKLANTRLRERYLANKNWDTRTPEGYEGYPNLDPFYPRFWEDRLTTKELGNPFSPSYSRMKPRGVFVCDMSDLFGIGIPEAWTVRVLEFINMHPYDRFYLLTKQPQNLIKFSPFPDNYWVGVSVSNTSMYIPAINWLDEVEARIKYLSLEPLLERISLNGEALKIAGIKWVIIGAQTKPTVYPEIEWVQEIVQACDKAGIPVFLKDNLKLLLGELTAIPNGSWCGDLNGLRQEMPK